MAPDLLQDNAPATAVTPSQGPSLVWLRRDLRLSDHAALSVALQAERPILPVFLFDEAILAPLREDFPNCSRIEGRMVDRRVAFLRETLKQLQDQLEDWGGGLVVRHGHALEEIPALARAVGAARLFYAGDHEPAALTRDAAITRVLEAEGCEVIRVKDQSIFERTEVLTGQGRPFSVFTPYKNAWLKRLAAEPDAIAERSTEGLAQRLLPRKSLPTDIKEQAKKVPSLEALGFAKPEAGPPIDAGPKGADGLLQTFLSRMGNYQRARDFPSIKGPSYLSVHLRFGTVSIRALVRQAQTVIHASPQEAAGAQTWLSELIWRDFYMQVLANFPHVVGGSFKPAYDRIQWLAAGPEFDRRFAAWCNGQTGYPLVDAGMRQLNQTGYMHNRLRMVVASFLTKDLGIDWRHGEAYFARHLNDFDLSANNGGWQWAASTGCDAQPYFRIFNPVSQSEKFDPKGQFIRRYVPELAGLDDRSIHAPWLAKPVGLLPAAGVADYPPPVVDHATARAETLARFAVVKAAG